jgi:hypothetical protein
MLKTIKIFILLGIYFMHHDCVAQGSVVFIESGDVSNIFNDYVIKNKKNPTIKGWRIQILSTDDRKEMESVKSKFTQEFPSMPVGWKHISPYYQIRVGAFRSKAETLTYIYDIKKSFPAAIAVQDDVKKIDFISY